MNPAVLATVRGALADWRHEADSSQASAEYHERLAAEHRTDQKRAEQRARDLEDALRAEGIAP